MANPAPVASGHCSESTWFIDSTWQTLWRTEEPQEPVAAYQASPSRKPFRPAPSPQEYRLPSVEMWRWSTQPFPLEATFSIFWLGKARVQKNDPKDLNGRTRSLRISTQL